MSTSLAALILPNEGDRRKLQESVHFFVLLELIEQMAYVVEHKESVKEAEVHTFEWYIAVLTEINEMLADRTQVP
jgi:hypothetical protein